ncbi:unnamed protein product [Miscanthus lutarioriparius]|uniref:Uncharacterized protein n=1 Tax=Miscanthus lutarioriparius TaxID=422564 RepID=A0A811NPS4_9POAL|nr:unnamed protein product [Miscanthus lutarioriparius]
MGRPSGSRNRTALGWSECLPQYMSMSRRSFTSRLMHAEEDVVRGLAVHLDVDEGTTVLARLGLHRLRGLTRLLFSPLTPLLLGPVPYVGRRRRRCRH